MSDRELMELAIHMAEECEPDDPDRILSSPTPRLEATETDRTRSRDPLRPGPDRAGPDPRYRPARVLRGPDRHHLTGRPPTGEAASDRRLTRPADPPDSSTIGTAVPDGPTETGGLF